MNYSPTPPPTATFPTFVDIAPTLAAPGTVVDDSGTGRGHTWVDIVGPDPTDPTNASKVGPPDGLLDLVLTNSDSPELPLGAGPSEWVYPAVAETAHPCVVYRRAPSGELTDVTAAMMPGASDGFDLRYPGASPWGALAADYDGDGDQDLFYPCGAFNMVSQNALMRSNGDGTFENVSTAAGMLLEQASFGAVWFDYDRDGDLDIYHANAAKMFDAGWQGDPLPSPIDRLHRNEGDGTFTEVGALAGCALESSSFATAATDLDRDGWLDLAVSCFRRYNKVYYNDGDGTFSFMAPARNEDFDIDPQDVLFFTPSGKDKDFATIPPEWDVLPVEGKLSIPVEVQDFNGDGWVDILYGCWSVQIPDDEEESALGAFFAPWDRAYLYLNRGDEDGDGFGDGTFREAAVDVGLDHVGGVMGMFASDFNGDGYLDVFMGGGGPDLLAHLEEDYLYVSEGGAWPVNFQADPDQPLSQVFYEVGALAGTYANINMAHGVTALRAASGRMDMMIANGGPAFFLGGQPNFYLENTGNDDGSAPNYVEVELTSTVSPPSAYGARVDLIASADSDVARWTVQERHAGIGFVSQNDGPLVYGVGDGGTLALNVTWPSGVRQGVVLFPTGTETQLIQLDEPTFSLGTDLVYGSAGGVELSASIEETGTEITTAQLWFFTITPVGGGGFTSLALPLGAPLPFAPQVPLVLGGAVPFLPEGLYGFAAVDPVSGALLGAGSVWHDPAAALAAPAPDGVLAQEPEQNPVQRPRRLFDLDQHLALRAQSISVAPARAPLVWETLEVSGAGSLALPDGSRLSWSGGAVQLDSSGAPETATASVERNGTLEVALGQAVACCSLVPEPSLATLLRFEEVSGEVEIDGRRYTPAGVLASSAAAGGSR